MPKPALEVFYNIAENVDGKVYQQYSGRGMFGKKCIGITCSNPNDCIEEAAAHGIRGASTDGMGLKTIVYWPSVSYTEEEFEAHGDND